MAVVIPTETPLIYRQRAHEDADPYVVPNTVTPADRASISVDATSGGPKTVDSQQVSYLLTPRGSWSFDATGLLRPGYGGAMGLRYETVDLGGYELTARIRPGDTSIPVVHVNALGTTKDQWDLVVPRLFQHTTITYDRAGIGDSDRLPPQLLDQPRTLGALAEELHRMLDALMARPPYVVVGHSIGALIALMYTARHRDHTAGLVLVDGTPVTHLANSRWPTREGGEQNPGSSILDIPESVTELTTAPLPEVPAAVLASAPGRWTRLCAADTAEYAPLTPEQLDQQWQHEQQMLARTLHAPLIIADWAGHHIPTDQPELVAACISAVHASAHDHRPVTIPAAQLRYAGGSCPAL